MSKIFVDQTLLTIRLDTGNADCATAEETKIYYRKPSGAGGSYEATVADSTKLVYNFQEGDIDETGNWQFQTSITVGGLEAPGDPYDIKVWPRI